MHPRRKNECCQSDWLPCARSFPDGLMSATRNRECAEVKDESRLCSELQSYASFRNIHKHLGSADGNVREYPTVATVPDEHHMQSTSKLPPQITTNNFPLSFGREVRGHVHKAFFVPNRQFLLRSPIISPSTEFGCTVCVLG